VNCSEIIPLLIVPHQHSERANESTQNVLFPGAVVINTLLEI